MQRLGTLLFTLALAILLSSQVRGACGGNYGDEMGSYRGVIAYSNGSCTATGSGTYQCVEFVRRFYRDAMHFTTSDWTGDGSDYFGSAEAKGLRVFDQGGAIMPMADDILCFGGGTGGWGHVAIVTSVTASSITILDQNRTSNIDKAFLTLTLTESGGQFTVTSFSDSYPVQGWLRGYTCRWSSQTPSAAVNLAPGDAHEFTVSFANTSRPNSPDWTNDGGDLSIELRSCSSDGSEAACFFAPVAGKPSWLDPVGRKRIVRSTTSNIGTDQIATFTFWGEVPESTPPGPYNVYFRPYHNSGQWIQNWDGMHFSINVVAGWVYQQLNNNCTGPIDLQGRRWMQPEYDASQWAGVSLPNSNWGCDNCDRYYRYHYSYAGVQSGKSVTVQLSSDDGCELYANGLRVGGWGSGTCHNFGCVNGPNGCASNQSVPAIDITPYLHDGSNLIAVHVTEGSGGEYFNCTFNEPAMVSPYSGVCCLGTTCRPISQTFTCADCFTNFGVLYPGKQYDCATFSPCAQTENKAKGDPTLVFSTPVPIPSLPATLTFGLVDSIPHTAWFDLPSSLGGGRIYISDFSGQFTVHAQTSAYADTVDLLVQDYNFQAAAVSLNGLSTGPNAIRLDTAEHVARHGYYCVSTGHIELVVPALMTNDLYPAENPIHSRSYVRGSMNLSTGEFTSLSDSYDLIPNCCVGTTGNVTGSGIVDVSDLSFLVAYLTSNPAPELPCSGEANVNATGIIDVSDLSLLVAYLTTNPPPALPSCP